MKFGSHLYGTDTPQSDTDYKSVFVPSAKSILLQQAMRSVQHGRTKEKGEHNTSVDVDEEGVALHRYLQLLGEGQTNMLDMVFAPHDMLLENSAVWEELVANKHRFITRRAAAFVGYCRQQANKYGIKGSRVATMRDACYLLSSIIESKGTSPKLETIAPLLETFVANHGDHSALIDMEQIGRPVRLFEVCGRKLPYTVKLIDCYMILKNVLDEYGSRALAAEKHEGIDWKALSHAVRVGQEALELLETGRITFPLKDAAYIRDIKLAKYPYKIVATVIERLLEDVEASAAASTLPDKPDQAFMDDFVCRVYANEVKENYL